MRSGGDLVAQLARLNAEHFLFLEEAFAAFPQLRQRGFPGLYGYTIGRLFTGPIVLRLKIGFHKVGAYPDYLPDLST